jgi:hypothetical protein
LINRKKRAKIGAIAIDCVIDEVHSYENEITQFPVEDGSQVADNRRPLPIRLRMSGIFSDTPVRVIEQGDSTQFLNREDGTGKSQTQFNEILKIAGFPTEGNSEGLKDTFGLITVVTGLRVYQNMAIASVNWPRSAQTGRSLRFNIDLVEIKQAKINFIDLPAVADINNVDPNIESKAESKADQGTNDTEEPTESGSLLFQGGRNVIKQFSTQGLGNPKLDAYVSQVPIG